MPAHRLYLPLLLVAATGCHSFGPLVKRDSELNCPTDIRRTVPWCAGEDAIFHCPCGPDGPFYGHRPTCWRTWPAPAAVWRDEYCNGGQCPSGMCMTPGAVMVEDPQMIELPTPDVATPPVTPLEPIMPAEESPLPAIESDAIPAPTVTPIPPVEQGTHVRPKLENPVKYTPSSYAPSAASHAMPSAAPAVLQRPVAVEAEPVLEPLPPMTQAAPVVSEFTAAVTNNTSTPACGDGMQTTASAPRPTLPARRPSGFARALAPRRDMPTVEKPVTLPPAPVATSSFAAPAPSSQPASARTATAVAPAVAQTPTQAAPRQPVVTTLSILPGTTATAPAAVPAAAPVVRSTPIESESAAPNPNQGRSGWIFVR